MNPLRPLSLSSSQAADLRIKVVSKRLATKRTDDSRSSKRHLKITIDNGDQKAYEGHPLSSGWPSTVIFRIVN